MPPSSSLPSAWRGRLPVLVLLALLAAPLAADDFPEKTTLTFGFIRLTDCATLVIAKEKGFFDDEFLDVRLESQANWRVLLDRVITGELDGAHMLAGQPIGAAVGVGADADIITAFSMNLSGNAITVSNEVWAAMKADHPERGREGPPHPISATALAPVVDRFAAAGRPFRLGMVYPVSTHNYELRYWLAAGGIHPGFYTASDTTGQSEADVLISVTPPPQMPATLAQGTIHGYCVGEPWNQAAVFQRIGVPVVTGWQIWKNNPEKVLGVHADWAEQHPNTHLAVIKALLRAAQWLDASVENRREAARLLARPEYIGADEAVLANALVGTFEFEPGDVRDMPDHVVFFRHHANYPFYSDAVWFFTQMRRWGQIAEPKPDAWYHDRARQVYRPAIFRKAARRLIAEGHLPPDYLPETDGFKPPDDGFIDGLVYDGRRPNDYLSRFEIGHRN
ncbi:MAG: nitrate ABC transporter substrate-binding protein [Puniceicoccaceae bacterium]|nr:MAG: nitrate ABC transporter substrate-binding protein [Puniceicoccaceae bacterium]